jgi:hypothetical protein
MHTYDSIPSTAYGCINENRLGEVQAD